jgi:hypothetical protein
MPTDDDMKTSSLAALHPGERLGHLLHDVSKSLNQEMLLGVTFEETLATEEVLQRIKGHLVDVVNR